MLITALSVMLSYLLKELGRRLMKRYELTIEHYNDYSCLMFTAMDALCADKGFKKYKTRSMKPAFPSWYWKNLPATLSTSFCARQGEQLWLLIP